jgi:hypothetical protein
MITSEKIRFDKVLAMYKARKNFSAKTKIQDCRYLVFNGKVYAKKC